MKEVRNIEDWRQPYLIQRIRKPQGYVNPFDGVSNNFAPDSALIINQRLFTFDYMGSAEFEWGAVPKALRMLSEISNSGNLYYGEVSLGVNCIVYFICDKIFTKKVIDFLETLFDNPDKVYLKEYCGLREHFLGNKWNVGNKWNGNKPTEYQKEICGWLELQNPFMFFADKKMYENTLKALNVKIGKSEERLLQDEQIFLERKLSRKIEPIFTVYYRSNKTQLIYSVLSYLSELKNIKQIIEEKFGKFIKAVPGNLTRRENGIF